jgi:hypothetical protein
MVTVEPATHHDITRLLTERLDLYRLYHTLELWDWFAQTGYRLGVNSAAPEESELESLHAAEILRELRDSPR